MYSAVENRLFILKYPELDLSVEQTFYEAGIKRLLIMKRLVFGASCMIL